MVTLILLRQGYGGQIDGFMGWFSVFFHKSFNYLCFYVWPGSAVPGAGCVQHNPYSDWEKTHDFENRARRTWDRVFRGVLHRFSGAGLIDHSALGLKRHLPSFAGGLITKRFQAAAGMTSSLSLLPLQQARSDFV